MFCSQCGNRIEEGDRFCGFCGAGQIPEVSQSEGAASVVSGTATSAVQPQAVVQPQAIQPQAVVQPQAIQPQAVVQPQPVQPQPQVIYVQQPVQQAAPQQEVKSKKKPPIALFIILGVLLTIGLIVLIIVILIGAAVFNAGKKVTGMFGNQPSSSYKESVFGDFDTSGFDEKEDGKNTGSVSEKEDSSVKEDTGNTENKDTGPGGNGDTGQPGDRDIGQFANGENYFSTIGRPSLEDFDWYYSGEHAYRYDAGVTWLDASQYQGRWKGMIIYPTDGSEELVNFDISVTPDQVTLVADWYMIHIGGNELLPEEDMDDTTFTGYEWGNGIRVEGPATIELDEFWEVGGTQFGLGTMTISGGTECQVMLVRP